jgi:dihydropteroate synthase
MRTAGIALNRMCLDPGIGFGKTLAHNVQLLQQLTQLPNRPILIGVSRKRMIGDLTGKGVDNRAAGSVAAALFALNHGAQIVRVHDVAQTVDAIKVWRALAGQP